MKNFLIATAVGVIGTVIGTFIFVKFIAPKTSSDKASN